MKTTHGVIQGYDGVAVVDGKHQVVVHAEAFGVAQEHDLLIPMIEGTRENFEAIGHKQDVFEKVKLTADSGLHTEANMKEIMEQGIDGYIADTQFRKRDPRFVGVDKYKERFRKERAEYYGTAEPVFGNICSTVGLNRFTLRGKRKVNIQWLLYCSVHNLFKVHRYGPGFA